MEIWDVIEEGPFVPTKLVDGRSVKKPKEEWNNNDKRLTSYNHRAMHILYCSLSKSQFNKVQQCSNAQEIWQTLEVAYEGTSQVKENKISLLVHKYELFKMEEDESIQEMFDRFNDILNGLKSLGKSYTNSEIVRKILRALPKTWASKKDAILEAKDLNSLPLEELIGSLLTHEMSMEEDNEKEGKKKKKKDLSIALKASKYHESSSEEERDKEADSDDVEYLSKKFCKFFSKKREAKEANKKKSKLICYECNKPGHARPDCPHLKKHSKRKKRRFFDDDSSSSSDDEIGGVCLTAIKAKEKIENVVPFP